MLETQKYQRFYKKKSAVNTPQATSPSVARPGNPLPSVKEKTDLLQKDRKKEMKKINPHSGTFVFSRHKNPRFKKQKSLHFTTHPCPLTTL